MLVLKRRVGQALRINGQVIVRVLLRQQGVVTLEIEAPPEVSVRAVDAEGQFAAERRAENSGDGAPDPEVGVADPASRGSSDRPARR